MSTDPHFYKREVEAVIKKWKVPVGLEFRVEVVDIPGVDRITLYLVGLGQYVATDLIFVTHTIQHIEYTTKEAGRQLLYEFGEKLGERADVFRS